MYQLFFILTIIGFVTALLAVISITRKAKVVKVNYCQQVDFLLTTNF